MQSKQVACKPPRAVFDKKKIYINILHEFTPRIYPMTKTNYFVISQILITTPGTRMNNLIAPINPNKKQDKRNIDIFQLSHPLNINNSIHPHKIAQSNLPRTTSPITDRFLTLHLSLVWPHHHHPTIHPTAAASAAKSTRLATSGGSSPSGSVLLRAGAGDGRLFALELAVLVEVDLERLNIIFESESSHGPKEVVAVDSLAFLSLTLVGGLASDEADELRNALLNRLLCVFGDLAVGWQGLLHDPAYVGYRKETVLLSG